MTWRPPAPKLLLRWSVILAGCVLVSIGLLRLRDRDRFYRHQLAELAEDERLYAERWPVAGSPERAWIRQAAAHTAKVKAEYEWASRYPWRSTPNRPAASRAGD